MAILIVALALTLAVSISRGNNPRTGNGAATRATTPAAPDYCNLRLPDSHC